MRRREAVEGVAPAVVILAAGAGRRLGRGPKALLEINGRPLVERQIAAVRGLADPIVLVLGADAAQVRAEADLAGATVVINPDWAGGMASSYVLGVTAAAASGADAIMIMLVAQPGVARALVARLVAAHRPGRITLARYRDDPAPAHPMIFATRHAVAAAAGADGDHGARAYLRAHPDLIDRVDASDLTDGADLDTPADLRAWIDRAAAEGDTP